MDKPPNPLDQTLIGARQALQALCDNASLRDAITQAGQALAQSLQNASKVLACGNGGSACDAMHFCEELTGRFRLDRPALPAMALLDPAHLTCVANDFGFDQVFSRMVEAHGNKGDCLVVLSTSGDSPNIIRAAQAARERSMTVIALLGGEGGAMRNASDHEIIVPGSGSDRIQELHMLILHALVEMIEQRLFPA